MIGLGAACALVSEKDAYAPSVTWQDALTSRSIDRLGDHHQINGLLKHWFATLD